MQALLELHSVREVLAVRIKYKAFSAAWIWLEVTSLWVVVGIRTLWQRLLGEIRAAAVKT